MFVNEPLADEAFGGSAIQECKEFGHFQSGMKGNWDSHSIQSW